MLHLILTETGWVVSRHPYRDWREVQAAFEDYKTSLPFEDGEALLEWWQEEYSGPVPASLLDFLASDARECAIR